MHANHEPADPPHEPSDEEIEITIAQECDKIIKEQTRRAAHSAPPPAQATRP